MHRMEIIGTGQGDWYWSDNEYEALPSPPPLGARRLQSPPPNTSTTTTALRQPYVRLERLPAIVTTAAPSLTTQSTPTATQTSTSPGTSRYQFPDLSRPLQSVTSTTASTERRTIGLREGTVYYIDEDANTAQQIRDVVI